MTRINCIPPSELSRQHLFAEIRELPRVRHYRPRHTVPTTYRLGEGHVIFFLDKGIYLEQRHRALLDEWFRRGHQCNIPPLKLEWAREFMNDWIPTEEAQKIDRRRIAERNNKQ